MVYLNLVEYEDMANDAWLSAYLGYQYRTEGKIKPPPLIPPEWNKMKMAAWLKKHAPDVILSSAAKPYFLLQEMGVRIPEDIGYVTLDHAAETLECAGIHQPREWMGAKAVDLVVEAVGIE